MQDARDLADYIIIKAASNSRYLTPLQVIKLCYLTHGFTLRNHGHGAFCNNVEAWSNGLVIPDVYYAFEHYGRGVIRRLWGSGKRIHVGTAKANLDAIAGEIDRDTRQIADIVVEKYADVDGGRLIGMTHEKGTPWQQTRKWFRTVVIPTKTIESYYKSMKPDTIGR